jgi:5-methylcytosine-specific restriction endonuclease McrA
MVNQNHPYGKGIKCPQRSHNNPNSRRALILYRNNRKDTKQSIETRLKIGLTLKGGKRSLETRGKMKENHWIKKDNPHLWLVKENHHNWRGGKSYEPYTPSFDKQTKERVRVRDNFQCQLCGIPELECYEHLHIHHIDYDKKNCDIKNLISLCRSCHCKTIYHRDYWNNYFTEKIEVFCE